MAARLEVGLKLNLPQFTTWNWIFGEDGKPFTRRTIFSPWGRGVGKSWFKRQIWWTLVAAYDGKQRANCPKPLKGVRITVMMPTLKQFRQVHWADIEAELTGTGPWAWLGARLDKQTCQITFPGGSRVVPFPAASHNARTARGMRTDVLDTDECDDIDAAVYDSIAVPWLSEPWSLGIELPGGTPTRGRHGLFWRMLTQARLGARMRRGEIGDVEVLATETAKSIVQVFADLALELAPSDWPAGLPNDPEQAALHVLRNFYGRHSTYKDAPETVSPLAVARAKATTPLATFNREWNADPDAGEGLVYPFDADFHVIGAKNCPFKEIPPYSTIREFLVGMDHGLSDPGVLLLCGILGHGEDAIVLVLDEHYESNVPNHVWNERAKLWRHAAFYPDPSRSDRVLDLRSMGLDVRAVDNSILAGVARVAEMLFIRTVETGERFARLYVSPKCVETIREFGVYRRRKHTDGTFDEMPEDKNNHCLVAGTRVLTDRGEVEIERIRTGDNVLTRGGWKPVDWSGLTFVSAPIWRLTTSRGVIEGTPDHPVWTENRSWVRLDALRYGDMVSVWESTDDPLAFDSTAQSSADIQTRQTQTPPTTSAQLPAEEELATTCIERSGHSTMAQSPTGTTSTTRTRTRSTTISTISSACLTPSISHGMPRQSLPSNSSVSVISSSESGLSQWPGTEAQKAERGIPSMRETPSPGESHSLRSATSARNRSSHGVDEKPTAFARTTANRPGVSAPESTTCSELALSAQSSSQQTSTAKYRLVHAAVEGCCSAERSAPVYDLTVRDQHEFFANGILVHNSMDAARYVIFGRFGQAQNSRTTAPGR